MAGERQRRLSPNQVALVVLALIALVLLLWQQPWNHAADEPAPAVVIPDAPQQLTSQLRAASVAATEFELVEALGSAGASRGFARAAWASLTALDASEVELRYISGGEVADRSDGTSQVVAEVTWRPGRSSGLGGQLHRSSVAFRVEPQADGTFGFVAAAPRTGALPLWLAGEVSVQRGPSTVVVSIDGGTDRLPIDQLTLTAREAVVDTLPAATGSVVVISPRSAEQMAEVLGQPAAGVRQIAAVTTHLDVSSAAPEDAVVVLNPAMFATMDARAAQVVLSHEATHQLTGAVGTRAETWVVEGFADYVALRGDTAPLEVSAGQILSQVSAGGAPSSLPTTADFASADEGLGAVYESSWMIFRLLAERHSAAELADFYEAVLGGEQIGAAVRDSFDLTLTELTAQWRDYLTKSASTVS